jgi:hypothetical protein
LLQDPTSDEDMYSNGSSQAEVAPWHLDPWHLDPEIPDTPIGEPILFATAELKVDSVFSFGFVCKASHDNDFGKIVMYLNIKGEKPVQAICDVSMAKFLTRITPSVMCEIDEAGYYIRNNVMIAVDLDDNSLSLTFHPQFLSGVKRITLTYDQLERMRENHSWYIQMHLNFMEGVGLLIKEAFHDIITEARMYAQGHCAACKSLTPHDRDHTCDELPQRRLESVLTEALHPSGKWPCSEAMNTIYRRLAPHIDHFKGEFRRSMEMNEFMCEIYKVDAFPNFVI